RQLLHHLLDARAPRAGRQRPDSLLKAFGRLRRNPPPWLPFAREAEPQELPLHWPCHRALLAVDLELQPPIDERRNTRHHPLPRPFAAHVDIAIVSVAHEAMTTAFQLSVELVQHD